MTRKEKKISRLISRVYSLMNYYFYYEITGNIDFSFNGILHSIYQDITENAAAETISLFKEIEEEDAQKLITDLQALIL